MDIWPLVLNKSYSENFIFSETQPKAAFNPFVSNAHFLYPWKHGVEKGYIGNK